MHPHPDAEGSADTSERLARCFAAVFPQLRADQIRSATPRTVDAWDSVAHVTLVSVVEEEFGIEVPIDGMERLDSFDALEQLVRAHAPGAGA